ncbi:MAG: zinc ribbon domain-containing protein [Chloroflexi bacterium]|nr:zinc ribbon domain-containing protein [Chloroflexota bacterium]MCL4545946.1 zinc ribbon domain-containing protein [Chloroflexota bacterium]
MLTVAPRVVEILVAFALAYVATLSLTLVIWTFRDIQTRTTDVFVQAVSTLFVAVFNLPGLILYLILRPHETLTEQYERSLEEETLLQDLKQDLLCPSCNQVIQPDFQMCPHCRMRLKRQCVECGRMLELDWSTCPFCTTPIGATVP